MEHHLASTRKKNVWQYTQSSLTTSLKQSEIRISGSCHHRSWMREQQKISHWQWQRKSWLSGHFRYLFRRCYVDFHDSTLHHLFDEHFDWERKNFRCHAVLSSLQTSSWYRYIISQIIIVYDRFWGIIIMQILCSLKLGILSIIIGVNSTVKYSTIFRWIHREYYRLLSAHSKLKAVSFIIYTVCIMIEYYCYKCIDYL